MADEEKKKGRQAKRQTLIGVICPHCAKSFDQDFIRVVDTPAEPGESHFEPCTDGSSDSHKKTLFSHKNAEAEKLENKVR